MASSALAASMDACAALAQRVWKSVGRLAGARVQLELLVDVQVDRSDANQVIDRGRARPVSRSAVRRPVRCSVGIARRTAPRAAARGCRRRRGQRGWRRSGRAAGTGLRDTPRRGRDRPLTRRNGVAPWRRWPARTACPMDHRRHRRATARLTSAQRTAIPSATTGITGVASLAGGSAAPVGAGATATGSADDIAGSAAASSAVPASLLDLVLGHRTAQVAHRPAGREQVRRVPACPAQHELALVQAADRVAHRADVDAAVGGAHAGEQAVLVPLGLQPADHPRPGVADRLVVDVHRVLGGQHHADAERACLLHQRHDRLLRRRHCGRREVPSDLVHVDQRPQVGGAALAPHPRDDLGEQQRRHELALVVGEVGGRDDGTARLAVGPVQERPGPRAGYRRPTPRTKEMRVAR